MPYIQDHHVCVCVCVCACIYLFICLGVGEREIQGDHGDSFWEAGQCNPAGQETLENVFGSTPVTVLVCSELQRGRKGKTDD